MSRLYDILNKLIDSVQEIPNSITKALQQAKDSGEFKGDKGDSGVYTGKQAPTDDHVDVWLNPEADEVEDFLSKLYFKPGDSVTFRFWTAGTITNQGKHVHFALPFDRPIIAVDRITISDVKAQIRQNDTYLLGDATSEGWATPDLCRVMLKNTQGLPNYPVVCTIEFNTAPEGVINNDAVGISFEGVVTFE